MPTWDTTLWDSSQDDDIWYNAPWIADGWSAALYYRFLVGDQVAEVLGWGAYPYSTWLVFGWIPQPVAPVAYRAAPTYSVNSSGVESVATVVMYPSGAVIVGSTTPIWQIWFNFIYARY